MRGFLAPFDEDCWILGDITVEMDVALRLPRPPRTINSGLNSVEPLLFYSDILLRHLNTLCLMLYFPRPPKVSHIFLVSSYILFLGSHFSSSFISFVFFVFFSRLLNDWAFVGRCNPSIAPSVECSQKRRSKRCHRLVGLPWAVILPPRGFTGWILRWLGSPLVSWARPSFLISWRGFQFWSQMSTMVLCPLSLANRSIQCVWVGFLPNVPSFYSLVFFFFWFAHFSSLWQFHDGRPSGAQRDSHSTPPKYLGVHASFPCHMRRIPSVSHFFHLS